MMFPFCSIKYGPSCPWTADVAASARTATNMEIEAGMRCMIHLSKEDCFFRSLQPIQRRLPGKPLIGEATHRSRNSLPKDWPAEQFGLNRARICVPMRQVSYRPRANEIQCNP